MEVSGLHLILTYQCIFECDHCFVWGSPWQNGAMRFSDVEFILYEAKSLETIDWIYFEGGEPTLQYPVLLKSVIAAHRQGLNVGLVTNAYWANSYEDSIIWLQPFIGMLQDLSISSDLYHNNEILSHQTQFAIAAAAELDIPAGVISITAPNSPSQTFSQGMLQPGESCLMFRGRAAEKLSQAATQHPWDSFSNCPYEELIDPGRVHIDPFGIIHICQGISIGNIYQRSLEEIFETYSPETHPIISALIGGGPSRLVDEYNVTHQDQYADACHLCYSTRLSLRERFPEILAPDQVYGAYESN